MKFVYLVQHKNNGYVHVVLTSSVQATRFVRELNNRGNFDYHVIERELYSHFTESGDFVQAR